MKKILFGFLLSITSIGFAHNCHDHGSDNQPMKSVSGEGFEIDSQKYIKFTKDLANGEQVAVVNVNGMVCDFCARGLEKVFKSEKAVSKIVVDLDESIVSIRKKPDKILTDTRIKELILKNGYSVEKIRRSGAKSESKT